MFSSPDSSNRSNPFAAICTRKAASRRSYSDFGNGVSAPCGTILSASARSLLVMHGVFHEEQSQPGRRRSVCAPAGGEVAHRPKRADNTACAAEKCFII